MMKNTDSTAPALSKAASRFLATLCLFVGISSAAADNTSPEVIAKPATQINRLEAVQQQIDDNHQHRLDLRRQIDRADAIDAESLEARLAEANDDNLRLQETFEELATGSVDKQQLEIQESTFDWKEEITLVLQPILSNLKALTEKPREINHLNWLIEHRAMQEEEIKTALLSIDEFLAGKLDKKTKTNLELVKANWEKFGANNTREIEAARARLDELQNSDVSWSEVIRETLTEFFKGRGLTLLIALLVGLLTWLVMRALKAILSFRSHKIERESLRTRRRLLEYSYRALSIIVITVTVVAVFYVRGDLLLLGLSIVAIATLMLGLRQAIPRYISEAQMLLDIGPVRENERVTVNGLPWQVKSLNVYSILQNPELAGVLRIPLKELSCLNSRPLTRESWFPTSRGDIIQLDDKRLLEVLQQSPDKVELKDAGGAITSVSTPEFYHWQFKNISKSDSFGVVCHFGVDYAHLNICLQEIPKQFRQAINETLAHTDFADHLKDVLVEFSNANSSSLDYLIYVTLRKEAARSYFKVQRLVQQACVSVCERENWNIPFPQLTVHRAQSTELHTPNHSG